MNPDDIARILDDLGQRLGPTGEYVFSLAVRQVYIDALIATVFLVLPVVACAVILPRTYRWVMDAPDSYSSREIAGVLTFAGLLCWLAFAVINAFLVIPDVLNPEYAALRDILGAIR